MNTISTLKEQIQWAGEKQMYRVSVSHRYSLLRRIIFNRNLKAFYVSSFGKTILSEVYFFYLPLNWETLCKNIVRYKNIFLKKNCNCKQIYFNQIYDGKIFCDYFEIFSFNRFFLGKNRKFVKITIIREIPYLF